MRREYLDGRKEGRKDRRTDELTDEWVNFHHAIPSRLPVLLYLKSADSEVRLPLPSPVTLKPWFFFSGKWKEGSFPPPGAAGRIIQKVPNTVAGTHGSTFPLAGVCQNSFLSKHALFFNLGRSSLCPGKETRFYGEAGTGLSHNTDEQQGRNYY